MVLPLLLFPSPTLAVGSQPSFSRHPTTNSLALWVFTMDYDNKPVGGVVVRYEVAGTSRGMVQTRTDGGAAIPGTALEQIVRARVEDTLWSSYDETQEGRIGGPPLLFQVFSKTASEAKTREERMAQHRAKIRAIIAQRQQAGQYINYQSPRARDAVTSSGASNKTRNPSPPRDLPSPASLGAFDPNDPIWGSPVNLPIVALAAGIRREDSQGLQDSDSETTSGASVAVAIIDGRGQAIVDQPVSLWKLGPAPDYLVSIVGMERSDAQGRVSFRGLASGAWYRAECVDSPYGDGRSSVFPLQKHETLKPIVVRPHNQTISGFILRNHGPAGFATIRLLDSHGQSTLRTVTDPRGYFVLGPVPTGPVNLEISHRNQLDGEITLPIPVDRDAPEMVIPLDSFRDK